jgi:hypothetical protein
MNSPKSDIIFDHALKSFLNALWSAFEVQNAQMVEWSKSSGKPYYEYPTVDAGNKYLRIVRTSAGSRSVCCFVEKSTGDILKAAGWKAPAKGARASIFKPESYAKCDAHGSWLYRG